MTTTRTSFLKLACAIVAFAAAALLALAIALPQQANAATTSTYGFDSTNVAKVKTSSKKIKILGAPYNTASWNKMLRGWYTYKINSKTKFRKVVNTETGKTAKVKKSTALKTLKKNRFIMAYITCTAKGVAKKVLFGV